MDHRATLRGINPHTPRHIPIINLSSRMMADVVAVLLDPYFFISDAQHELSKRKLKVSGSKNVLMQRLFEALKAEHAEGWTLGYLLNTKIVPFHSKGRDPRSLIGHHVEGYKCDGDGIMLLELSDGEDVMIHSNKSTDTCARIKMDDDLFWAFHTLDGMEPVPRRLANKPLLVIEAVPGVRKNRWGKEAGTVLGLKLEGMGKIAFFFAAGEASIREDRVCGDVWLAENDVLREDIRLLHGGDEMVLQEGGDRRMEGDEAIRLEEDMRAMHGH